MLIFPLVVEIPANVHTSTTDAFAQNHLDNEIKSLASHDFTSPHLVTIYSEMYKPLVDKILFLTYWENNSKSHMACPYMFLCVVEGRPVKLETIVEEVPSG